MRNPVSMFRRETETLKALNKHKYYEGIEQEKEDSINQIIRLLWKHEKIFDRIKVTEVPNVVRRVIESNYPDMIGKLEHEYQ